MENTRGYFSSILTAVCFTLVVAPPIRRGTSKLRRFISEATCTISSKLGVINPDNPMISAFTSFAFDKFYLLEP